MIIEITYSQKDLRKRCYGCKWLKLDNEIYGECICEFNKIKNRDRCVTDKACSCKNYNITDANTRN